MEELTAWLGGADALTRVLGVALLVAARVAPLTLIAPWIALPGAAASLRVTLGLVLTLALTPVALVAAPPLPDTWLTLGLALAREATIGAIFAAVTSIPLFALDQAGRAIDAMRGASGAESSPLAGEPTTPLGSLYLMLGTVLFLALGGHRLVLAALGEGLVAIPPGTVVESTELATFAMGAARIVVASLTLAVSFAAPAAAALLALETALGVAGRAAPALPLHFAAMPLRAVLGIAAVLLGLSVLMPHLPPLMRQAVDAAAALVSSLAWAA